MSYNIKSWVNLHFNRADISINLTHLTKTFGEKSELEILLKILQERKIIGCSTKKGFIIGKNRAVCFQDMPIYGVSQNCLHELLIKLNR